MHGTNNSIDFFFLSTINKNELLSTYTEFFVSMNFDTFLF